MYTVKQVAEKMGISVHTLRFYDKEGLFPHVSRDEHNARVFLDKDLEWVYLVQCLRATGMPLAEMKRYVQLGLLGDATLTDRYRMIKQQTEKADQELAAMEERKKALNKKAEHMQQRIKEMESKYLQSGVSS